MCSNSFPQDLKETIKAEALNLGFCVIGFTSPDKLDIQLYQNWIDQQFHAGMSYLASDEAIHTRHEPANLFPKCKTIISLGSLYPNPAQSPQQTIPATSGKIAHYATERDYHQVLENKANELMESVQAKVDIELDWISAVDTKPLAERELARKSGLGWIAKNSMLTNPTYGSALFLCEILLNIELPLDTPFHKDLCGTCTKCIDACPTNCILSDRTIDANKCISYLTIEHRGIIDESFFDAINSSIFGCDICLQVCPWNKKAKSTPMMKEFASENQKTCFDIPVNLEKITNSFHRNFEHSAIRRAGKQGFLRNCMIRLSENPTNENMEMIDSIVSGMSETYLHEQKQRIKKYISTKKGS